MAGVSTAPLPKKLGIREGALVVLVSPEVDEYVVRHTGLATGLVDNKVCAIDDTWSGLAS